MSVTVFLGPDLSSIRTSIYDGAIEWQWWGIWACIYRYFLGCRRSSWRRATECGKSSSINIYHTQSLFGISKTIIAIFLQFSVVRTGADELDVDKKCSRGDMDRCNQITAWHHLLARVPKCFIYEHWPGSNTSGHLYGLNTYPPDNMIIICDIYWCKHCLCCCCFCLEADSFLKSPKISRS